MHTRIFVFLSLLMYLLGGLHNLFAQESRDFRFASIFSSGAVLQQGCPLPIWGTARPNTTVKVSLDEETREAQANRQGKWSVLFDAQNDPGMGHTLSLTVGEDEPLVLEDIAIGEVWLCAGQDGIERNFWNGVHNSEEELKDSEYSELRLFRVQHALAFHPKADVQGKWITSRRDVLIPNSACAFFFGRALYQNLGVPIGLIDVSRSGTIAETWLSLNEFGKIPGREKEASNRLKFIRNWLDSGEKAFEKRVADWDASYDGSDPYEDAKLQPWDPTFTETDWIPVEIPSTFEAGFDSPAFDGTIWFRYAFKLTAEQAAAPGATLHLGSIDDSDITWVNGTQVGKSDAHNIARNYVLPAGTLKAGSNMLVVRAHDSGGTGGFMSRASDLSITFSNGTTPIPLAGTWRGRSTGIPKGPRPENPNRSPNAPGYCFNGMIAPLFPLAIRGVLWYHGPANVTDHARYPELIQALANEWRQGFSSPEPQFPFLLAEIGAFEHNHGQPVETDWAAMRWTTSQLGHSLPNAGSIPTLDLGNTWSPWLSNIRGLGDRLASLAMLLAYHDDSLECLGPYPTTATLSDDATHVILSFEHAYILETSDDKPPTGFQLAGEDGVFKWAPAAEIIGETVVLSIPEGMTPTRVRHAWDNNPKRNLVGSGSIACSSFELPIQPQP